MKIKIAIADDHQLFMDGIKLILAKELDIEIISEASNGLELIKNIENGTVPNVIITDIRMPVMDGIEMVQKLRAQGTETPVLMLTTFDDSELFSRSLDAGANGFLLKDVSLEKLVHSIESLVSGGFVTDNLMLKKWQQDKSRPSSVQLTERELQILRLLVGGMSNKEIVRAVFLAEGTVRNHVSNILAKMECRDRTQAVLKAMELGLV